MAQKPRVKAPSQRSAPSSSADGGTRRILYVVAAAGAALLAIGAVVAFAGFGGGKDPRGALEAAGCTLVSYPGVSRDHIDDPTARPKSWNSFPPTSGPHFVTPAVYGFYDEPVELARVLHGLEHGGVFMEVAERYFRRALDLAAAGSSQRATALAKLAAVLQTRGQFDEAVASLEEAIPELLASDEKSAGVAMGYRFQFVTLAGFHAVCASMFDLARGYAERGMSAYVDLQEHEFALEEKGYTATRHQREVGAGYFDAVLEAVTGGESSTLALKGSTEEAQFIQIGRAHV